MSDTSEETVLDDIGLGDFTGAEEIVSRRRAFSPELRELAEKVISHGNPGKDGIRELDSLSEDDLIGLYHGLFYRAIHLQSLKDSDTSFNPFTPIKELGEDRMLGILYEYMNGSSHPAFVLLSYHLEKRCFIPSANYIGELDPSSLYIDINDEIYGAIVKTPSGILLSPEEINNDPFLRKRFVSKSGGFTGVYYINSLRNIYSPVLDEFSRSRGGQAAPPDTQFSPIIIIKTGRGEESLKPGQITAGLSSALPIIFLLYTYYERNRVSLSVFEGLRHVFRKLEYFYDIYTRYTDGRCYVILAKDYFSLESRYMLSYFDLCLRTVLSGRSLIAQVQKDRIIVFTCGDDIPVVDRLLDGWSAAYDNFTTLTRENRERKPFLQFLTDCVF